MYPGHLASLSDRELLLLVAQQSEQTHEALFGNGQPGLSQRVSSLEGQQTGRRERWGTLGAAVTVFIAGVGALIKSMSS